MATVIGITMGITTAMQVRSLIIPAMRTTAFRPTRTNIRLGRYGAAGIGMAMDMVGSNSHLAQIQARIANRLDSLGRGFY
jgi:hypothetical protein